MKPTINPSRFCVCFIHPYKDFGLYSYLCMPCKYVGGGIVYVYIRVYIIFK